MDGRMYTKIPKNLKTDDVLPPVSEIPSLIRSLRHPRKSRSVSIGPQSEADAYEALAFRDRRRRESNISATRIRRAIKDEGSNGVSGQFNAWETSFVNPLAVPHNINTLTPASSQVNLSSRSLSPDVFMDGPSTPNSLPSAASTPGRRLSEDRRQHEKDEKEIFSMLEKPRVRPRWLSQNLFHHFMQSEPTEATQTTSLDSHQDTQKQSQYGLQEHHSPADSFLHRGGRAAAEQASAPRVDTQQDTPHTATEPDDYEPQRRLSSTSSRSTKRTGSPVDRIIEHEEATVIPPKRRDNGPAFTIVQRKEVLTHILSHLPASSLSEVSLVSHRFHSLVTSPHAWRAAFSRHFPAQKTLALFDHDLAIHETDSDTLFSERRVFTRLTALASWRSEYILRTHLLHSLGRGKPEITHESHGHGGSRSGTTLAGSAQITYNSNLVTTVNHLHATFGTSLNKRFPTFIHGADEAGSASLSEPKTGKVDQWGFTDPRMFTQFTDDLPGMPLYGLGPSAEIGVPNCMDVSRQYGMVYAEGTPGGMVYYRSTEERRGRLLASSLRVSQPEIGLSPLLGTPTAVQTPCSVWIAKTCNVPDCSDGLIGILSGSSKGVVTAYSLGTSGLGGHRIERGEITYRWILSPGVPIIALAVDDNLTSERLTSRRVWAVALNALGEIYFLTEMPKRSRNRYWDEVSLEHLAWQSGRTVYWAMVEPSRRVARLDPFQSSDNDGSYSPRSSWNGMGLSPEQIIAETKEIEKFLCYGPQHFRKVNEGWDMRRRLELDFAGDDGAGAGENVVVIQCGLDEGQSTGIKRYTRCKILNPVEESVFDARGPTLQKGPLSVSNDSFPEEAGWSFGSIRRSPSTHSDHQAETATFDEWRISDFAFGGLRTPQITATAMDLSTYALLSISEDPLLRFGGSSITSSPTSSPLPQMPRPNAPSDAPGQRARLLVAGTRTGTMLLWNMRDPVSSNTAIENTIKLVRVICTDSPQISCVALSALYLVHGGNDGLVQAWDPLASTTEPVRTLNSRFSSRARRRLAQAEASPQGVGINLFAAGAIFLDPDPTVLRGIVSLGSHLRYWSYSSSAADQYKSSKRRLRRSGRRTSSNQGSSDVRFSGTGRSALKDYIANEKMELEKEKVRKRKEEERLAGRFGLDLLGPGATEEEILAYATMLSEEAAESDEQRRKSESGNEGSATPKDEASTSATDHDRFAETDPDIAEAVRLSLEESTDQRKVERAAVSPTHIVDDDETAKHTDPDIAEGIRLSLQESNSYNELAASSFAASFPIKVRKAKRAPSSSPPPPPPPPTRDTDDGGDGFGEQADLDFALRLSLAEEESRVVSGKGKGKGKEREL
ncbi:MAG: hypothetical protein Q9219_001815 [cf. Caloplaca sp. 3 TL-2023]